MAQKIKIFVFCLLGEYESYLQRYTSLEEEMGFGKNVIVDTFVNTPVLYI